jgi:hypothetical protein
VISGEAVARKYGLWGKKASQLDEIVLRLVQEGVVPGWLRRGEVDWRSVRIEAEGHVLQFQAAADYVSIGDDEGWLRVPMYPATAQAIADLYDARLPSSPMVQAIYEQCGVPLWSHSFGSPRDGIDKAVASHDAIESDRGQLWGLVAGHKKDIVVTARRQEDRLVIFGWWDRKGKRIQEENRSDHSVFYKDYSHGVRLIQRAVIVDGKTMELDEVMRNEKLCGLVSSRGPIVQRLRYVPRK